MALRAIASICERCVVVNSETDISSIANNLRLVTGRITGGALTKTSQFQFFLPCRQQQTVQRMATAGLLGPQLRLSGQNHISGYLIQSPCFLPGMIVTQIRADQYQRMGILPQVLNQSCDPISLCLPNQYWHQLQPSRYPLQERKLDLK
jgi:hypothetical protein